LFNAINSGTKPMSNNGANHTFGGHANHIKNALNSANR
jgi:hypothetical protein